MATTSDSALGSLRRQPSRKWIPWIGLVLLAAGLGFLAWRVFAGRGDQGMQGPPPVAVKTERLESESLMDSSEFVGILDAQAGVSLQPEADGRIVQIFVASGDSVAAGDPIMQLSSQRSQSDYNAALASVSAARSSRDSSSAQLRAAEARQTELLADLQLQNNDYDRTAALVAQGALPQNQLDEVVRDRRVAESALASAREEIAALRSSLEGAQATLSQADANANATQQDLLDKTVTAPIAGIVGNIPVKLGDYVQAGDQLATITQNQDLDLEIAIPVDQAKQLRIGLPVRLSLFGSDDAIAIGTIRFISPTTDPSTQTVLAKARFSTPTQPLQDEQRLEVQVVWDERPGVLVPTTAITRLGGETFVFVPGEPDPPEESEAAGGPPAAPSGPQAGGAAEGQSEGQPEGPPPVVAKLKSVQLGDLQGNDYQVLEGLEPGDIIITEGILNLRDGVPIDTSGGSQPPAGAPTP